MFSGTSVVKLNSPALLVTIIWTKFGGLIGIRTRPCVLTGTEMLTDMFGIRLKPVATDSVGIKPKLYATVCVYNMWRCTCVYNIITPRACARGKVIGFVCRRLSSSSAQKSPDLEI